MAAVVDTGSKPLKENGRNAVKKAEEKEKAYVKELEVRGKGKFADVEAGRLNTLTNIMVKGRKEMSKLRLFKIRVNKIEFELKFTASRIKEILEEIKELREDCDGDADVLLEIIDLKEELKKTRKAKKDTFQNWKVS